MTTTRTPFRETGNTDLASFTRALSRTISTPSPMAREAEAIYNALSPHGLTRLGAAMCWIERRNETDPGGLRYYGRNLHNAWAIKRNGDWARYASYADAAEDWAQRVLGPTYANATSIAEFIAIYAPAFDGHDPEAYARMAATEIDALPRQVVLEPLPDDSDPWRPLPYPDMVNVHVVKPGERAGFDRVAPRGPRVVGICNHITDGRGSIEWYRDFFSTGGERQWDALTDTVIGRDGRIGLLNDWRDPDWGGRRAGWANGTATGIEGDGIAFYRNYPLINDVLVSIEHEGRTGDDLTSAQFDSSVQLSAAVAQSVKCPWDAYPYHPGLHGVNIEQQHRNFAPKACPAEPFISRWYPRKIEAVREILRDWQHGVAGEPAPEPNPVWYTRFGFTLAEIQGFFGTITRYNRDGTTSEFGFDTEGALSLFWLNRCDKEGKFPEAERIWFADAQFVEGQEMWASWEGGWMAFLPLEDSHATWRWLDADVE
jgi:hypothetical protein